jgi:hypothetical protein
MQTCIGMNVKLRLWGKGGGSAILGLHFHGVYFLLNCFSVFVCYHHRLQGDSWRGWTYTGCFLKRFTVVFQMLLIQKSGFDFRRYQIFWEVVGLGRGLLSLVSIIEELLGRKSSCSGLENRDFKHKRFHNTRHLPQDIWNTIVKLFLNHPTLLVKVILNRNCISKTRRFCYIMTVLNTVHIL